MSSVSIQGNASGTGIFTIASPNSNTNRTLTLPDATGTINTSGAVNEVPAGSASAPSIYPAGDTNTGIFFPAADTIAFTEGGTESMRIDSSGNVGIGTTTLSGYGTNGAKIYQKATGTNINQIISQCSANDSAVTIGHNGTVALINSTFGTTGSVAPLAFYVGDAEKGRFTTAGYFKASTSGTYLNATGTYHEIRTALGDSTLELTNTSATTPYGMEVFWSGASPNNTTQWFLQCVDSTNSKLNIYSSGTVTNRTGTYNSFSDIKLKQDITDASSQWNDIKALRIVKYRLKDEVAADPNYPAYIGVIAQEVEQVSPGLIDNCVDKNSGEVTKSVKSSIIYMKAVKALQEAMARIETLEARLAALEAK